MKLQGVLLLAGLLFANWASAQNATLGDVVITDAWVRGTVPGQKSSGAFMKIHSQKGAVLLGAASPVAASLELHETRFEHDVMQMRHVAKLPLAAGKTVELRPGAYHLMLIDLKQALTAGELVPLTLRLQQGGVVREVTFGAPVRALGLPNEPVGGNAQQHHH